MYSYSSIPSTWDFFDLQTEMTSRDCQCKKEKLYFVLNRFILIQQHGTYLCSEQVKVQKICSLLDSQIAMELQRQSIHSCNLNLFLGNCAMKLKIHKVREVIRRAQINLGTKTKGDKLEMCLLPKKGDKQIIQKYSNRKVIFADIYTIL